jgi:hypothetical protein
MLRIVHPLLALLLLLPVAAQAVTFKWDEEVSLSDGSTVTLQRKVERQWLCSSSLPGSCAILSSGFKADVPKLGRVEFSWKGRELPLAIDLVDGRLWLVIPILGLDRCYEYDNPGDSVVALMFDNAAWRPRPYGEIRGKLKFNLLQDMPPDKVTRVGLQDKQRDRRLGVEIDKTYVPRHAKYVHACHALNPPIDAEHERAMLAYKNWPRTELVGKVVSARVEQTPVPVAPKIPPSCRDTVRTTDVMRRNVRPPGGGQWAKERTYRIHLASERGTHVNLPVDPELAHLACNDGGMYVLLRTYDGLFEVLRFDPAGEWREAWRIRAPKFERSVQEGPVLHFEPGADHFEIVLRELMIPGKRLTIRASLK